MAVVPASIDQVREAQSRRLLDYSQQHVTFKPEIGPEGLDFEPGQILNVVHYAGPRGDAVEGGWTQDRPNRRIMRYSGNEVDAKTRRVRVHLEDLEFAGRLATFHDSMRSRRSASNLEDGVARFHTGGAHLAFSHGSAAWAENPGDGSIVRYEVNQKRLTSKGLLLERFGQNYVFRGAFDNGVVNWLSTPGSGTITVVDLTGTGTSSRFFDLSITANCVQFTAGSPQSFATDIHENGIPVAADLPANDIITFSAAHLDMDGTAQNWWLQRVVDSFWWNDATAAWQSGVPNNAFPITPTTTTIVRDKSKPIPIGGTATKMNVFVGLATGGTDGRRNRIYQVQLESKRWASSPIVTLGTAVNRFPDLYTVTNHSGARVWHATRGSGHARVTTLWSTADIPGEFYYLLRVVYDANNLIEVYYHGTNGTWVFRRLAGGVDSSATIPFTMTAGTQVAVGWRWESSEGELEYKYGASASGNWGDICVNGSWSGVTAVQSAAPTETSRSWLEIGHNDGQCVEGHLGDFWLRQWVMSDEEMGRALA